MDEIKCKICSSYNILNSNGKCYNCKDELGQACQKWQFLKKEENDNIEELQCIECTNNYNLNVEGHCISYKSYQQIIPQCASFSYEVETYTKYNFTEFGKTFKTIRV
jgi:hypothetical protein